MTEEKGEDYGKILFSWKIPEYPSYKRGAGWYIGFILIFGGLIFYAIWTANFLFAIILALAGFIVLYSVFHSPQELRFEIREDGIILGDHFYPYKGFKSFWIIYEPPEIKNLYLDFKGWRPKLSVPLMNQNPLKVRETLLKYLEEDLEKEEESTTDYLSRRLKI